MMKNKKTEHDDVAQVVATPVQKPKKSHIRKVLKISLISFLTFLCVVGGVLVYHIHTRLTPVKTPSVYHVEPVAKKMPVIEVKKPVVVPQKTVPVVKNTITSAPAIITPKDEKNTKIPRIIRTIQSAKTSDAFAGFNLKEALELNNAFLAHKPCADLYQKLSTADNKTAEALDVLQHLSTYCTKQSVAPVALNDTFIDNKKQALIAYYQLKYPFWIAYFKVLPVSVIEIRKLNPTSNKPTDILYKAQNALLAGNLVQSIDFINHLPPEMTGAMMPFVQQAGAYLSAQNALKAFILSY